MKAEQWLGIELRYFSNTAGVPETLRDPLRLPETLRDSQELLEEAQQSLQASRNSSKTPGVLGGPK